MSVRPQTAVAITMQAGDVLRIVDVDGEQVADLALFDAGDVCDSFSPGRTMDYNESLRLAVGDILYSNQSTPLARVVQDSVGVHDLLLAPCSEAMFARRGAYGHPSCHNNLVSALGPLGVGSETMIATLNVFMNVRIEPAGQITILPPPSKAGDYFAVVAACDLIVGLAACSSELTNNGSCKPIGYELLRRPEK